MLITISVIGKGVFMSSYNNQFKVVTLIGSVDMLRINGLMIIIREI